MAKKDECCGGWQVNRKVPDFQCDRAFGHSGPHHDPRSNTEWGYPDVPYGCKKKRPFPQSGDSGKRKVWWEKDGKRCGVPK